MLLHDKCRGKRCMSAQSKSTAHNKRLPNFGYWGEPAQFVFIRLTRWLLSNISCLSVIELCRYLLQQFVFRIKSLVLKDNHCRRISRSRCSSTSKITIQILFCNWPIRGMVLVGRNQNLPLITKSPRITSFLTLFHWIKKENHKEQDRWGRARLRRVKYTIRAGVRP